MTVKLNTKALAHARDLVKNGRVVRDDRDDWSEHAPAPADENEYLAAHDFGDYALWHLGEDRSESEETKGRYSFPFGDFSRVHRCAVISAESRAGQYHHDEIRAALKRLLDEIDA